MPVWINEFHYDNAGTDAGEFIEIAGTAGTDLTGWTLVRYNGANGLVYGTTSLSGMLTDQASGFGFRSISLPVDGLQNGAPDGFALVDGGGVVIQFLSYEGAFTAVGGAASAGSCSQMVARQSSSFGSFRSARTNSRSAPRSSASENTISGVPSCVPARSWSSAPGWMTV